MNKIAEQEDRIGRQEEKNSEQEKEIARQGEKILRHEEKIVEQGKVVLELNGLIQLIAHSTDLAGLVPQARAIATKISGNQLWM